MATRPLSFIASSETDPQVVRGAGQDLLTPFPSPFNRFFRQIIAYLARPVAMAP
jgi:hypothetical protein